MTSLKKMTNPVLPDVAFIAGYISISIVIFAALRLILLYRNFDLSADIPFEVLLQSFIVGLRFDLIVINLIALPLVFFLFLSKGLGSRKFPLVWLGVGGAIYIFMGVAELDFYHEFHTRLNSLAFQYIKEDTTTVLSMIWHGFPVIKYLLLWSILWLIYFYALLMLNRRLPGAQQASHWAFRVPAVLLVLFFVAWGARGTLRSGPPLRWGDAFHSQYLFANHLALNGTYTLVKAALRSDDKRNNQHWLNYMPSDKALQLTRGMLLTAQDTLLNPLQYPVLRHHTPKNTLSTPPKNIVFIIMESFSAEYVGAFGHEYGITPAFDKLVEEGLLFDQFFSNGTHTHQGMFATVACFPNLPGHEYLMQQPEGQHQFSGLPALLIPQGFNDTYVYNGDFAWDNQKGFFRNQGMTRFLGRDAYENPVFMDPTWGVSDQDMFNKAGQELDAMSADKPFFAVLQTLSNHTPYALPDKLPVEPVTGFGELNQHLTAQRYSDWALGQFFEKSRQKAWFKDTLFVVVGDHGFATKKQLSQIDLMRFHVPLLILAPGIQETYGKINHKVGSQVDIVPTVVSLLGRAFIHQCWGRDLLALPDSDPGFAIVKPSGSDQTIALIEGTSIFIKPPDSDARIGKYTLLPGQYTERLDMPQSKSDLSGRMGAFLQTSLNALKNSQTGVDNKKL